MKKQKQKQKQKSKNSKPKKHKWLRRIFRCVVFFACLSLIAIAVCYIAVNNSAKGRIYNDISQIPYREVGLLLGTTPYLANGNVNFYYDCRMKAAAQLYHEHKISFILVSGDNHVKTYDEPTEMRSSLMALGVPESAIFLDYAGFRTLDSMIRAKKVFGQDSVTVISQSWHNKRAIFLGRHNDLDAIGFNARDSKVKRAYIKMHLREALSRVKAVLDVCVGKQPKFLGDPIEIK